MTTAFEDLLALQAAQDSDAEAVETEIGKVEEELKALDRRHLTGSEVRRREREIRDGGVARLRERRTAMLARAAEAEHLRDKFSAEALRRAALVDDAPLIATMVPIWANMTTPGLLDHLADAVVEDRVGVAEALRQLVQSREDRGEHLARLSDVFARLQLPLAAEGPHRIAKVVSKAEMAQARILELMRGQTNPVLRLAAFRAGRSAA